MNESNKQNMQNIIDRKIAKLHLICYGGGNNHTLCKAITNFIENRYGYQTNIDKKPSDKPTNEVTI